MKKYILKQTVYNNIDFPRGTIVKVNDPKWEFEVVSGKLKGQKGNIADGVNGWLLEDTPDNRKLVKEFNDKLKSLKKERSDLYKNWDKIPTAKLPKS